jgi:Tol biopolymer transport system component
MASGKRAFERPESVQTMSAILTDEPEPLPRTVPAPLRWAIDRCLAKDPADRYDSTRDLYHELRNMRDHLAETGASQMVAAVPPSRAKRSRTWVAIAAGLGVLALSALVLQLSRPQVPDQSTYRYTPFSFEAGGQTSAQWSPDGKAVAYGARESSEEPYQLFVRYLDSPTAVQITHFPAASDQPGGAYPLAWSADGKRSFFFSPLKPAGIWSIASVGGEPQPVLAVDSFRTIDVARDGRTAAVFRRGEDGSSGVWISSPLGAPLRKYTPDPFATREVYNTPNLHFSPDGKQILLFMNGGRHGEEAWLMPVPADAAHPPRRVLLNSHTYSGTPDFSWMPDSRHVVVDGSLSSDQVSHLWLVDLASGERHAVTGGTIGQGDPVVSPAGDRILFSEQTGNYDVISVDLDKATSRRLLSTARDELMPAWAAKQPVMAFVTNRAGPQEIWLHRPGDRDRPILTEREFPPGATQWLMAPALSPDADRVAYGRVEYRTGFAARLWISAASGGAPVPLTDDSRSAEFPGSWSPDGSWFTYGRVLNGKVDLMKVKTSGEATPTVLAGDTSGLNVPSWSPNGEWIGFCPNRCKLISPDGKTSRDLGAPNTDFLMFSADSKTVYGMHSEGPHEWLFAVDIATGKQRTVGDVGREFRPGANVSPATRFSLAPDGKSFVYGSGNFQKNLWMLEGFNPKTGILARLGLSR